MKLSFYPTLTIVAEILIEYNVKESQQNKVRDKLQSTDLEPVGLFDRAEAELAKFSETQLDELLVGEKDDESFISEDATDVITALFEMITK